MITQLTVTAWLHDPGWPWSLGWLALPNWLLSRYYMSRASPGPPFLYKDWKKRAWAGCYPLSCFSLGSFAGLIGKHDYLENFQSGSRHHNTRIPANRAGSVVMLSQSWFLLRLIKVPRSLQSEPARLMLPGHKFNCQILSPRPWTHRFLKAPPPNPHTRNFSPPRHLHTPFPKLNEFSLIHLLSIQTLSK